MILFFIIGLILSTGLVFLIVRNDKSEKGGIALSRPFLLLFFIGSLICSWYLYQSYDVLKNTNYNALERNMQYGHYTKGLLRGTYFVSLILILGANLAFMRRMAFTKWAFLLVILYFSVFVLLDKIFLEDAYFHFKKNNGLWRGEFSVSGFGGLIYSLLAAGLVSFNYWFLKAMTRRK